MISLCPACKTEQMITAIALQENRGLVCCEACAEAFKPRGHRVTASRERAFKQRLKDLQLAMATLPEEIVLSPVNYDPADFIEQGKNLQNDEPEMPTAQSNPETIGGPPNAAQRAGRAGPSIQQSLQPKTSDIMRTSSKQQPAPTPNSDAPIQTQLSREGGQMKQSSQTLSTEAIQRNRMRKERHWIARQKLLLEYEKLKVENEKLAVEKKKIELEKVKLKIMAKHQLLKAKRVDPFVSKGPALDGRPVVEYDSKTDLLPRTPNAIDRGAAPAANKSKKVHLELMPTEPSRLVRKNLASRSKSFKAK